MLNENEHTRSWCLLQLANDAAIGWTRYPLMRPNPLAGFVGEWCPPQTQNPQTCDKINNKTRCLSHRRDPEFHFWMVERGTSDRRKEEKERLHFTNAIHRANKDDRREPESKYCTHYGRRQVHRVIHRSRSQRIQLCFTHIVFYLVTIYP